MNCLKRGENAGGKAVTNFSLNLQPICPEDGASFLDQSQGKMNQHRRTPPTRLRWTEALDTALKTALLLMFTTNLQEIRMGLITSE